MKAITVRITDQEYDRLQRVATQLDATERALVREFLQVGLDSFEAHTATAVEPPPVPARRVLPEMETVWTPHRDAASLIPDIRPGESAFHASTLVTGARKPIAVGRGQRTK
jgi:hypothetical protein